MADEIPILYEEHHGTVRVSGKTIPRSAGYCAFSYLNKQILPIDFFYIGGNAGQQAMKAMSIFSFLVDRELKDTSIRIAFRPLRFSTITKDPVTGEERRKDAVVWRTVLLKDENPEFTSKESEIHHIRD